MQTVTLTFRVKGHADHVMTYDTVDTAVRVLKACTSLPDSNIVGWSIVDDTDPCPHNGLFATNAPDYGDTVAYQAWLDTTRLCHSCRRNVPNSDL